MGSEYERLIGRWGCWRRLSDGDALRAASEWKEALGVRQPVRLERISRFQVVNERGRRGCSLVGVVHNDERATIFHTRALMAEDIVHELLHVAHPAWSEDAVVAETSRLLERGQRGEWGGERGTWSPAASACAQNVTVMNGSLS